MYITNMINENILLLGEKRIMNMIGFYVNVQDKRKKLWAGEEGNMH